MEFDADAGIRPEGNIPIFLRSRGGGRLPPDGLPFHIAAAGLPLFVVDLAVLEAVKEFTLRKVVLREGSSRGREVGFKLGLEVAGAVEQVRNQDFAVRAAATTNAVKTPVFALGGTHDIAGFQRGAVVRHVLVTHHEFGVPGRHGLPSALGDDAGQ